MQEQNQPPISPFSRPSARPIGPVQRANYGLPSRPVPPTVSQPVQPQPVQATVPALPVTVPVTPQPQPTPSAFTARPVAAQSMADVAAPRPSVVPVTPPSQPIVTQAVSATSTVAASHVPSAQQPLFTNAPQANAAAAPSRLHRHMPTLRMVVLVIGVLIAVIGIGRWATAGSTSGQIIAVGAVSKNDGNSMTIQFTATDGQLHRFTSASNEEYIPGTAVQVAYRAGAPDKTVQQVAVVENAHALGVRLFLLSLLFFGIAGVMTFVIRRRLAKRQAHLPVPVTA